MSFLESIDALITDTVTVTRHLEGGFVDGIYYPGTALTFDHTTSSFTSTIALVEASPVTLITTGTLPAGLNTSTTYYVFGGPAYKLSATADDATNHVPITFADNGAGSARVVPKNVFTADVVMQPAFGLNRVVGGRDLQAKVDNQSVTDVRDFFTRTEFRTRTPSNDPDEISFDGSTWTVDRVEQWNLSGQIYYRVLVSRQTAGAS